MTDRRIEYKFPFPDGIPAIGYAANEFRRNDKIFWLKNKDEAARHFGFLTYHFAATAGVIAAGISVYNLVS